MIYEAIEKLPFYSSLDQEKFRVQKGLYEQWKAGDPARGIRRACSTVVAATGFGKTTLALLAAKENDLKGRSTIALVPSVNLKQQLAGQAAAWGIGNIHIETVQKVVRDKGKLRADLLIIDEVHNVKAPQFRKVFDYVDRSFLLGLTATFPDGDQAVVLTRQCPVVAEVTREEAIERNFVTDFRAHIVNVPMAQGSVEWLAKTNRDWEKAKNFFLGSHTAIFNIVGEMKQRREQGLPVHNGPVIRKWMGYKKLDSHGPVVHNAMKGMNKVGQRTEIMFTEPAKTALASGLAMSLSKKGKVLVFCKRKGVARELHGMHPESYLITGDTAKAKRPALLGAFGGAGHNTCYTADALNEGVDVPNIGYAVLHSFNSRVGELRQRIGRAIRLSYGQEGKRAHIFILKCSSPEGICPDHWWLDNVKGDLAGKTIEYNINQFKNEWIHE